MEAFANSAPPPDEDGITLANGKHLQENINGASCRKLMDVNNKINFMQLCTSSDIDVDPRRVTVTQRTEGNLEIISLYKN